MDDNWASLSILDAQYLVNKKCHYTIHDRVSTTFYQLGAKFTGKTLVIYNGKKYDFTANTILYLPKEKAQDIPYTRKIIEPSEGVCIFFNSPCQLPSEPILFQGANIPQISKLFIELSGKYAQNDYLLCMSTFYKLLSVIRDKTFTSICNSNLLQKFVPAIVYMRNHCCDSYVDISVLADMCHMTNEYFRHRFKLVYHISPLKYFHNEKMLYAKNLLMNTDISISDVAKMLGFAELNYFSRFFKEHLGLSPTQYRNLYGKLY